MERDLAEARRFAAWARQVQAQGARERPIEPTPIGRPKWTKREERELELLRLEQDCGPRSVLSEGGEAAACPREGEMVSYHIEARRAGGGDSVLRSSRGSSPLKAVLGEGCRHGRLFETASGEPFSHSVAPPFEG